jgi:hypothetical protein
VGKLQTLIFSIIRYPLDLELGGDLARVADGNLLGFLFANEKALEIDKCLVNGDKRVLANRTDF